MTPVDWSAVPVTTMGGLRAQKVQVGELVVARYELPRGFDSRPLYVGLPDDRCPCEHWCVLLDGHLTYHVTGGTAFDVRAGDTFYVPPSHVADVHADAVLIEFTRAEDDARKQAHLQRGEGRS